MTRGGARRWWRNTLYTDTIPTYLAMIHYYLPTRNLDDEIGSSWRRVVARWSQGRCVAVAVAGGVLSRRGEGFSS